jgi:hypothetical protein
VSRFSRVLFVLICLAVGAIATPSALRGQTDAKSLKTLEDSINFMRRQRLALEARTDSALARDISERAKRLAMGGEVGALQRLELLLDSAQARLLAQRDRIATLKDASVAATAAATLVVRMRADALPAGDISIVLLLDGNPLKTVSLKPDQAKGLINGSNDELFRGEITATEHKVLVQITGKGLSTGETVTIPAAPKAVTYVEFTLKGGKLTPGTWANKASPF